MELRGKRLYRSRTDRRLAGVCGGLGEFFEIDPTLIRLLWILATAMTAVVPGILGYLAAWIVVPEEPVTSYAARPAENDAARG